MRYALRPICLLQIARRVFRILCSVAMFTCVFSCNSDKPDYLEPQITTLSATDIGRTEATLNGLATVKGETEMPQLYFKYGMTEEMKSSVTAVNGDNSLALARIVNLTSATTYYYMLEGTNGRATVRGNMMTFTTLPNDKPSLGNISIVSQGPMSVIVEYEIKDNGGEVITETGCLYALASSVDEKQKTALVDYRGDIGRQIVLLSGLNRNATYLIWPFAKSRMGETVGLPITFTTGNAVSLGEAGQLRTLLGENVLNYTKLTVAGPLNGDDLRCLREMMGRGVDNAVTPGKLADIDLTDAQIVVGGEPYDGSRYASDNVVGQGLFADCASLTKIALPTGLISVEKNAFARCTALESIEIPASAALVQPSSGCTALQNINVSCVNSHYVGKDGVLLNSDTTQIVWFPMGKQGAYSLPSTVKSVGDYAFKGCCIETFTLPDNITALGTGVFMDSKVKEVRMPENLRLVPTATFQNCTDLSVVRLGRKTELIADYAFSACPLTDIYIDAQLPPVCNSHSFVPGESNFFATCRVHVPRGRKNMYKASDGWKLFKNIITD